MLDVECSDPVSDYVEGETPKESCLGSIDKSKEHLRGNQLVESIKYQEKVEETTKKDEKWNLHQIERFLKLYEVHRCIWDYKIPIYKDRNSKEDAWKKIVNDMKMTGFTVKKAKDKIRVLRNTYSNELQKISKSKSSGAELNVVYVPTLRWFSTMDRFLGTIVQPRSQAVTLPEKQSHDQVQCHPVEDEETDIQELAERVLPVPPDNHSSTGEYNRARRGSPSTAYRQSTFPYKRPLSNKSAAEHINKPDNIVKGLKKNRNKVSVSENYPVTTEPCEYELFGQLVTSQLKKLPELNALLAMQQIQTYILDQRMGTISQSQSRHMHFQKTTLHNDYHSSTNTSPDHSPDVE